jgi:hypothetical protein
MKVKEKPIELPEAESGEAAAPNQSDTGRADELARTNPILDALWNAKTYEEKK